MKKQELIYDETEKYAIENNFSTGKKLELLHLRLTPELTIEEALLISEFRSAKKPTK